MSSPARTGPGPRHPGTQLDPGVASYQWRWASAWSGVGLILTAWCAWVLWHPPALGHFTDSVEYLILSEFFRGALGGDAPVQAADYFGHSRFPPLFPLALAVVGASPSSPVGGLLLTQVLAVLGSALFVAWYLRQGLGVTRSAILGLAAFACPAWLYMLMTQVSEPLLVLLIGAVLLRTSHRARTPAALTALACIVGLAPIARLAGGALVLTFGAWLIREREIAPWRRVLLFLVAAFPGTAWIAYRSLLPIEESYLEALNMQRVLQAFGGWSGLLRQPLALVEALAAAFTPFPRLLQHLIAFLLLALAAVSLRQRLRRNDLDAWFTPIYIGLVLVWPYPAEATRLLLVLLPILLLQASTAFDTWRPQGHVYGALRPAGFLVAAMALFACFSGWWHTWHRAQVVMDPELEPQRRSMAYFGAETDDQAQFGAEILARVIALSEELPAVVPPGDCVYTLYPAMAWVYSRRAVQVRIIPREVIDGRVPPDSLRDCRFLLVANLHVLQYDVPALFPLEGLRGRLRPVLHSTFEFRGNLVPAAYLFVWNDLDPQGVAP